VTGRAASPRVASYAGPAAAGLVAALVLRRPELVALAAPFALVPLVASWGLRREPPSLAVTVESDQALEGETVLVSVVLNAASSGRVDVLLDLPGGLHVAGHNPVSVAVSADDPKTVTFAVSCDRWGAYRIGGVAVRAWDRLALVAAERRVGADASLKVFPRPESLRETVRPIATQAASGNHVARAKGDGVEFADIRAAAPGDPLRRVNWRATARRGVVMVNEHHPERNTDVILFLDTFAEARRAGLTTLDLAVRAASSVATHLLRRKDRVALIAFGGVLRWLTPATGIRHAYRIVDSLLDAEIIPSYAWKGIDVIPPGVLPPRAMILALSPLLDERTVGCLLDARARGFDVVIVEVSPEPFTPPGAGERVPRLTPGAATARRREKEAAELAHRLWLLQRKVVRSRYERAGVPIVSWRDPDPLAAAIEEVRRFRRRPIRVRA
jgi:uncharacterized protein (DUF58 family)